MKKRKILSILIAFVMVLGLLPAAVFAGVSDIKYELYVGGVQVTYNKRNGDGWSYDPSSATLTLNGAKILGTDSPNADYPDDKYGIYSEMDLTLNLEGSNTITCPGAVNNSNGIYVYGKLTITGSGSLTVTSGDAKVSEGICSTFFVMKSGTVLSRAGKGTSYSHGVSAYTVLIEGGSLMAIAGESEGSHGIASLWNQTTISGGTVTAVGLNGALFTGPNLEGRTNLEVTVSTAASNYNLENWNGNDPLGGTDSNFKCVKIEQYKYPIWISGNQVSKANLSGSGWSFEPSSITLTLNNANITGAQSPNPEWPYDKHSIYSEMDITLNLEGSNTITCPDAVDWTTGILVSNGKNLTIIGSGSLNVTAGDGESSFGIRVQGELVMKSGTVLSTAGKGTSNSRGVGAYTVLIEGGTLTATANQADYSYGIYSDLDDITVKGGMVTAIGQTRGFKAVPKIHDYGKSEVLVNTSPSASGASDWDSSSNLSDYKYVNIRPETTKYDLWIGGVRVTSVNLEGPGWSYNHATKTLTLDGANITGAVDPDPNYSDCAEGIICEMDNLTLELKRKNTITGIPSTGNNYGIYCSGNLTITGTGSLDVKGGDISGYSGNSYGIKADELIIESGFVTAEDGETQHSASWGISAKMIRIKGGMLVAMGDASALDTSPSLSEYPTSRYVFVNTDKTVTGASPWNESTNLNNYNYVMIAPKNAASTFYLEEFEGSTELVKLIGYRLKERIYTLTWSNDLSPWNIDDSGGYVYTTEECNGLSDLLREEPAAGVTYYTVISLNNEIPNDHSVNFYYLTKSNCKLTLSGYNTECIKVETSVNSNKQDLVRIFFKIEKKGGHMPGDINGDGYVNNKDITRLMRYVKYKDVDVVNAALDVNLDNAVNNKDITRLMRYVKYKDVEIH